MIKTNSGRTIYIPSFLPPFLWIIPFKLPSVHSSFCPFFPPHFFPSVSFLLPSLPFLPFYSCIYPSILPYIFLSICFSIQPASQPSIHHSFLATSIIPFLPSSHSYIFYASSVHLSFIPYFLPSIHYSLLPPHPLFSSICLSIFPSFHSYSPFHLFLHVCSLPLPFLLFIFFCLSSAYPSSISSSFHSSLLPFIYPFSLLSMHTKLFL